MNSDYHITWWKTQLTNLEAEACKNAVISEKLSMGSITASLEERLKKLLDVKHVFMVPSGSAALLISLLAANIKPGDEVIVPNRTFIATAHAALLLGAKVKLVDTLPNIPLIDPEEVRKTVSPTTKACFVVHLNGRACTMEPLLELAKDKGFVLIEDAAQAFLSKSKGKYLGTIGDLGAFSFGVTKLVTSGQGGFVSTNDDRLAMRLRAIRTHGVESPLDERFDIFGFNFRYTDIQAAILNKQLDKLDSKFSSHISLYKRYVEAISSLEKLRILPVDIEAGELPLWVEILCNRRNELMSFLKNRGIQARAGLPDLNISKHLRDGRSFPHSKYIGINLLTLPCGPDQSIDDINYVIKALIEYDAL